MTGYGADASVGAVQRLMIMILTQLDKDEFFEDLITTLKRRLIETEQYLAVAEGQADGGPPGWSRQDINRNSWIKKMGNDFLLWIERWKSCGRWNWVITDGKVKGGGVFSAGIASTARDAIAAAEAAYQEAIANQGDK